MAVKTRPVSYVDGDVELEGLFAYDDAVSAPKPLVAVVHAYGGRGPFECERAEALAGQGYAGFAVDLYGKGVFTTDPGESEALMQPWLDDRAALQRRLQLALQAGADQAEADGSRAAAIGYCFGGLCVLDMARFGARLDGVVSVHGLFVPPPQETRDTIDTKILVLHGWDDPMVPPEQVVSLAAELTAAGADWQIHGYGRTMHAFTNPNADDPARGVQYHPDADRRSSRAIENFLDEVLR